MGQDSTILGQTWCWTTRCDNINCKDYYQIYYYLNNFIELSSESSRSKVLKIQDDEQEKAKDRGWSGLKADVFSIQLKQGDDKRHQHRMTYID